ncbi:hypothetical protein LPB86_20295 [Pedobacter sp. MC2016-14]|uniref:hypothetical protein n=1 Tax=Pedobacter sp. MC2016-14 TaxID=2897327 RepID=UPI001E4B5767|nr:hypothetical protein [Pedobacter sp. MC2016-14]MCD0490590.1 hypothetical protein [Pedobacter sp. MC2016-14]
MIEITIGILGLLIAWFTYKKTFLDKPKEEIEHLTIQFKATQATSMKVRNNLIKLSTEYGLGSSELFSGMTIDHYIKLMTDSYEKSLNDKLLTEMLALKPSKSMLRSMISSLEKQHAELMTLETGTNASLLSV